ncbi:MAG: class I SAM-dependent methyltransferase [Gammaproteobacteria bacterium]
MSEATDFGFQRIRGEEKARRVAGVFASVAPRYDLMNDLMSGGAHRLWKRFAVAVAGIKHGERILDLAGGTGDVSALIGPEVGAGGRVVLSDINGPMLRLGRDRLLDRGLASNVDVVLTNAEQLPFPEDSFDAILIAFGLRNVTAKERALASMHRVLRYGGRVVILEFSRLKVPLLQSIYDLYSFKVIPVLGQLIAGDKASYRYLVESIRMHPDQETLKAMMNDSGFELTSYYNLSGGIVAVHRGYKL